MVGEPTDLLEGPCTHQSIYFSVKLIEALHESAKHNHRSFSKELAVAAAMYLQVQDQISDLVQIQVRGLVQSPVQAQSRNVESERLEESARLPGGGVLVVQAGGL